MIRFQQTDRNAIPERIGYMSELVGAAIFLTSNELSSFVTGITIPVDGGYLAWGI